ncbi:MAG: hypothetical protein AB7I42_01490 [Bradyrhizobium sp.]|uniref:hypothetical protein n=1 Tax=Bradyrhizobium sp. TaxID=376 RepID=UPI002A2D999B|nr:hypothetical protein [Bradyrhizobium sp.]
MAHILFPEDPVQEYRRLLGQARHCRNLAEACEDKHLNEELALLAASYEAKAGWFSKALS